MVIVHGFRSSRRAPGLHRRRADGPCAQRRDGLCCVICGRTAPAFADARDRLLRVMTGQKCGVVAHPPGRQLRHRPVGFARLMHTCARPMPGAGGAAGPRAGRLAWQSAGAAEQARPVDRNEGEAADMRIPGPSPCGSPSRAGRVRAPRRAPQSSAAREGGKARRARRGLRPLARPLRRLGAGAGMPRRTESGRRACLYATAQLTTKPAPTSSDGSISHFA